MALRHLQRIRSIYHRPQATARLTQCNFRTKRQTRNLEARRSGYLRGCGFSLPPRHRTTARTAHLSSSQVRYSCPANIGSRLGSLSLVTDDSLGKATPTAANPPHAASKTARKRQKTWEVSPRGMRQKELIPCRTRSKCFRDRRCLLRTVAVLQRFPRERGRAVVNRQAGGLACSQSDWCHSSQTAHSFSKG